MKTSGLDTFATLRNEGGALEVETSLERTSFVIPKFSGRKLETHFSAGLNCAGHAEAE